MKTKLFSFPLAMLAGLAILLSACSKMDVIVPNPNALKNTEKKTIAELIKQSPQHSFLYAGVKKAGLIDALNSAGPFTVFAPTNDAFKAAGFNSAKDVEAVDAATLSSIILYHAISGAVSASAAQGLNAAPVATLGGSDFYVTGSGGNVWVNNAKVNFADIIASNGIIHSIDAVLMKPTKNLVELAQSNDNLSTLVAAVLYAGQPAIDLLTSAGPWTVFAPTNMAFDNLLNGAPLTNFTPAQVLNILAYHVVPGRVFSYNLSDGLMPATVQGQKVTIGLTGGATVKGNANSTASNIVAVNILATNGVVHVVDQVLVPNP